MFVKKECRLMLIVVAGCTVPTMEQTAEFLETPACEAELADSTEGQCPRHRIWVVDNAGTADACCLPQPDEPQGEPKPKSNVLGAEECVSPAESSCPEHYVLADSPEGPDCVLNDCAQAGYDMDSDTGECVCSCDTSAFPEPGTVGVSTFYECPGAFVFDGQPMVVISQTFERDVYNDLDACHYRAYPAGGSILELQDYFVPVDHDCAFGTYTAQPGTDTCVLYAGGCPDGAVQSGSSCVACTSPTNHDCAETVCQVAYDDCVQAASTQAAVDACQDDYDECLLADGNGLCGACSVALDITADDTYFVYIDGIAYPAGIAGYSWQAADSHVWQLSEGEHTLDVVVLDTAWVTQGLSFRLASGFDGVWSTASENLRFRQNIADADWGQPSECDHPISPLEDAPFFGEGPDCWASTSPLQYRLTFTCDSGPDDPS